MRIIARYLLSEFVKMLAMTVVVFTLVFFLVDFMERIDNFLEAGVPAAEMAYFFLMFIPSVVFYLTPVALLVAIVISLGLLARHSEIVALKAGGISLVRLSSPILLVSLLVSVLLFLLSDTIIPVTSARVNAIWDRVATENKDNLPQDVIRDIWFKTTGVIYHFRAYDRRAMTLLGITAYYLNENFKLTKRIEAAAAHRTGSGWELSDGMVKTYNQDGRIGAARFDQMPLTLPALPDEVGRRERPAEELSSTELDVWIRRMTAEGYDPLRYIVDYHFKFSFPFICAIVAIIGLPLAFWKERGGGITAGIGVGVGLSFVYLVFLGLSRSLGYSALLPPFVAAWLPNLIFTLFGLYLFTHVRQ
ncbi:MAG: LPS export ABC transporter permease LptG [Thermodesulfobacteriota bacterium]